MSRASPEMNTGRGLPVETDLARIRALAKEREEVNWTFRLWLKNCDLPESDVDAEVHRLYREVSAQIDCKACANCCRELAPTLGSADVTRLARELGMTPAVFHQEFLAATDEPDRFTINRKPCPFLQGNLCSHYESRPEACAGFPFLDRPDFATRSIMVFWNVPHCPIVFNVYERLRQTLGPRRYV